MADLVQEIEIYETTASINHIFIHFSGTTNISLSLFVDHAQISKYLSN
jgi:hypothetical protein